MNYVAIVGTNSDRSTNRQLLQYMAKHFADKATIEVCEIKDFPAFNEPEERQLPANIQVLSDKIKAADGVIISTPEYDHAIPAALKSLIEWISYTTQVFTDKPVMIIGASLGALGSSRAQGHLRQIMNSPEVTARIMPGREYLLGRSGQAFDESGVLQYSDKVAELEQHFDEFMIFTELSNKMVELTGNKSSERQYIWETIAEEEA